MTRQDAKQRFFEQRSSNPILVRLSAALAMPVESLYLAKGEKCPMHFPESPQLSSPIVLLIVYNDGISMKDIGRVASIVREMDFRVVGVDLVTFAYTREQLFKLMSLVT